MLSAVEENAIAVAGLNSELPSEGLLLKRDDRKISPRAPSKEVDVLCRIGRELKVGVCSLSRSLSEETTCRL